MRCGHANAVHRHLPPRVSQSPRLPVQWHQLAVNPADGVDLPQLRRREVTALTPDQARAVLAAIETDPLRALWTLMLTTGLRQGELLALRWRDVDLDAGRLTVTANSVRLTKRARDLLGVTNAEPLRGEPKTQRSRRVVELPSLAVEALRRHRTDSTVVSLDGRVFARPDGRTLAVPRVYTRWHKLLERAGVPVVWSDRMTRTTPQRRLCSARASIPSSSRRCSVTARSLSPSTSTPTPRPPCIVRPQARSTRCFARPKS